MTDKKKTLKDLIEDTDIDLPIEQYIEILENTLETLKQLDDLTGQSDQTNLRKKITEIIDKYRSSKKGMEERVAAKNDNLVFPVSRPANALFNPNDKDYIRSTDYDGSIKTLKTGKDMSVQLALSFDFEDIDNMTRAEIAAMQLSDDQRFWHDAVGSIAHDNPWETRIYGIDIIKKWGWANPWNKNSGKLIEEAAREIEKMTSLKCTVDVTNEIKKEYKRGKVLKGVQLRPIIDGNITLIEADTEDGKIIKDFILDLKPGRGKPSTDALPILDYSMSKGDVRTLSSDMFNFERKKLSNGRSVKPVAQVGKNHRRMLAYILKQAQSKGLSNTVLFDTMFDALGLDIDRKAKYRACNKIEEMLNSLQTRGYIKSWTFKHKGKAKIGITVIPGSGNSK